MVPAEITCGPQRSNAGLSSKLSITKYMSLSKLGVEESQSQDSRGSSDWDSGFEGSQDLNLKKVGS